jgi:hypothetical protein
MGERDGEDLVRAIEDDLAALAAADLDLERDAEVAERTRIERGTVLLRDRLRAAEGVLTVTTLGPGEFAGRVGDTGDGWVLLEQCEPVRGAVVAEHLVLIDAVLTVRGVGTASAPGPARERSVTSPLRRWCRDRSDVLVLLREGTPVVGRAEATYGDHLDVVGAQGRTALPLGALAVVSRAVTGPA